MTHARALAALLLPASTLLLLLLTAPGTSQCLVIYPGVAISLAVFGTNLLGDARRDTLDPRLRGT